MPSLKARVYQPKETYILKFSSKTIIGNVLKVWMRFRENGLAKKYTADEAPLRAELLSSEQMQQHGKNLAAWHKVAVGRAPDKLLTRLAENEGSWLEPAIC